MNSLESLVSQKIAELGVSDSATPLVLKELKRVYEAKALGTIKGKTDKTKLNQVAQVQSAPRFISSLRAHSRIAGKRVDAEAKKLQKHLTELFKQYKEDEITLSKFKSLASIAIKAQTEQAFQLGTKSVGIVNPSGSLRALTPQESKWLSSYLKEELKHFNKLVNDIKAGQSSRRVTNRLSMYATTIKAAYNSGRVLSVGPDVVIHWVLENDNPCPDCKLLHRYSPYTVDTLPTVPKGGQTRCLSHCHCSLRIVKSDEKTVNKLRKSKKSASWHLQKLKKNRKKR